MFRVLRLLAVLAASMLLIGGIHVASALANGTFTVSSGTTSYTGTQAFGVGHSVALPNSRTLRCSTATIAGSLANGGTTTIATPSYSGCSAKAGESVLPATVAMSSCKYHIGPLAPGAIEWVASTAIQCEGLNDIRIKLYANAASHTAGTILCEYRILPQTIFSIWIRNLAEGKVAFRFGASSEDFVEIAYSKVLGTIANCGGSEGKVLQSGDYVVTAASGTLGIHS